MAVSGQITVTTAGTAVQGSDENAEQGTLFSLSAHPDNTGTIWIGNVSGDVADTTGYPLIANGPPVIRFMTNLSTIWVDADTSGEKLCWIKLR